MSADLDLVIVGGGIGGIICLKYAQDAGLRTLLLERRERIGGLWRDLPSWQDIQFRKEDWTLGDLPLTGETQPCILQNIESWVERFGLAPHIRLNAPVERARPSPSGWRIAVHGGPELESRWLIAATGGHNRPVVPRVDRSGSRIQEFHSAALQDPGLLGGRRVTVVGGGASAYDLLDLCFAEGAGAVTWIYRSTRWMRPTRKPKHFGTDMRLLARYQMLGMPIPAVNGRINRELRSRYAKAGIRDLLPERAFDLNRDQLVPGRPRMLQNFARIQRHRAEAHALEGTTVRLSNGERMDTDVLLWCTGYASDYGYLDVPALTDSPGLNAMARRCRGVFCATDAPNLFLLAPGVLETNTSTPWAYAHAAKSIMSHIAGEPVFSGPPCQAMTNHFDLVKMLARTDRANYPFPRWYLKYLWLALGHSRDRPMPIP